MKLVLGTWHSEWQHYWFTWMWSMSRQWHGPNEIENVRAWECLYPRLLGPYRFVTCAGLLVATTNQWGSWGRPWEAVLAQQSNLNHILVLLNKAMEQNRSPSLSGRPIHKPSPWKIPWKYPGKPSLLHLPERPNSLDLSSLPKSLFSLIFPITKLNLTLQWNIPMVKLDKSI